MIKPLANSPNHQLTTPELYDVPTLLLSCDKILDSFGKQLFPLRQNNPMETAREKQARLAKYNHARDQVKIWSSIRHHLKELAKSQTH